MDNMKTYIPLLTTIVISCGTVQPKYLSFRQMDLLDEVAQEGIDALQGIEDKQKERYKKEETIVKEYRERKKRYEDLTFQEQMRRLEEYAMIQAICKASVEIQTGTTEYRLRTLKEEVEQAKIKRTTTKELKRLFALAEEVKTRIERSRLSLAKCERIY